MEDKTIQILRSTLEKSPELWDTRQHLAELLWASGDVQGTADVLAATPEWPEDEAHLEFAASVFAHTDAAYSIKLYDSVIARNSGNARAHLALAKLHMDADHREKAGEHYGAATSFDPSLADPQVAHWLQQGAVAEAPPEPVAPPAPEADPVPEPPAASDRKPSTFKPPEAVGLAKDAPPLKHAPSKPAPQSIGPFEMAALSPMSGGASMQQEASLAIAEKKKRTTSLIVAALVHIAIIAALAVWVIYNKEEPVTMIVAADSGDPLPPDLNKKEFAKAVKQKPNPASSAKRAMILTASAPSPVSVEAVPESDPDSFGMADNFGVGLGFGNGNGDGGGGRVMFFGDSAQVSRAVFVVDFSGSMSEGGRLTQLKKELDASLSKLPSGISYNVIYYSHRPWLGGENVGNAPFRDWEEPDDRVKWIRATPENIQQSREHVANMGNSGGTNWIPPIRLALAMSPPPNVIWLLTDGEANDRREIVEDMTEINPSNVKINTIGMEIGGPTLQSLIDIAEMTQGKFSVVRNGQTHTGQAARKFVNQGAE